MKKSLSSIRLSRKQLDQSLAKEKIGNLHPPRGGWIRTIRESLGMNATQLAKKLGITTQTMTKIEASERKGTITLSTLQRVADVLQCNVKLILVPKISLEQIVMHQALAKAKKIVQRTGLHMDLEAQGTDSSFQERQTLEIAEDLIRQNDRSLWEDNQ